MLAWGANNQITAYQDVHHRNIRLQERPESVVWVEKMFNGIVTVLRSVLQLHVQQELLFSVEIACGPRLSEPALIHQPIFISRLWSTQADCVCNYLGGRASV